MSYISTDPKSIAEAYAIQNELFKTMIVVSNIVKELGQRNSRFQYIYKSSREFRYEDFGILSTVAQLLLHADDKGQPELTQPLRDFFHPGVSPQDISLQDITESTQYSASILRDIMNTAIYEILNVYELQITVDQVPQQRFIDKHLRLLQYVYDKSKDARVRSISMTPEDLIKKEAVAVLFQYPNSLVSLSEKAGKASVRVLHILPGPKESCIRCKLEVRYLDEHGLDQALSYVWGSTQNPKCIWVEDKPFRVTANLHEALIALRHEDATRTIWVDAICINQLDLEEKAHQVRQMGETYSTAKATIIWLGGQNSESRTMTDPSDVLATLPSNFGGNMVDQYDLVGILERVHEVPLGTSWDRKRNTLSAMLVHCLNVIMSQEWWERVWTIQEAVLPREHPIIMFRGYEFSFEDFISAMKMVVRIRCTMKGGLLSLYDETPDTDLSKHALEYQLVHWENHSSHHVLQFFRPGQESQLDYSHSFKRSFHLLLCETSSYKATDPRDKCFALQAMLSYSRGALLYVDYNEPKEAVFKRATAKCYNGSGGLRITTKFKLLVESQQAAQNDTSVPSWTQDLTYSETRHCSENNEESMTFEAYLFKDDNWQPLYNRKSLEDTCFATPSTLFCSGVIIDAVCTTGFILDLRGEGWAHNMSTFLVGVLCTEGRTYWDKLEDNETTRALRREHLQPEAPEKLAGNIIQALVIKAITLFTFGGESSVKKTVDPRKRSLEKRLELIIGKQYFTTSNGLMGISMAPIEEGDILMAMDAAPAYFIIRQAKSLDGSSPGAGKHRIVARAIVHETQDEMTARMEGLETRIFQII
ncbi:heterokaryon incompatibility protein-domain-containing protein [Hypomontagnella monticulosa]|nr:heterokaryon incompatibility protein-domain-containing protein [Hypomontagnella monticulosa]